MRLLLLISVLIANLRFVSAQDPADIEALKIHLKETNQIKEKRIADYINKTKMSRSYRDGNGNLVLLVDITESGIPIYETTDNAAAATTIGVDALRANGNLGLNIQGNGITVAVWDGGIVKTHSELGDRLISTQGAVEDNHATHVTGTILASGINPQAKGMAPLARAYTYDFNNDETEMISLAKPDESSIILSNHSYGVISGWRFESGWQWSGDNSISAQEDYKFGYYSTAAKEWDQITFNAPYYTICKSAGNDRTDTGGSGHPPDCDAGTGFDCISDAATAKNIITVGAVEKVLTYTGSSSVKMSSFSSWGPTDDGRIKPDIVADGVNVFSLSAAGTNQYTSFSGTSMATPNVTGGLALLQELHKKLHHHFMRASTLKALVIHSAKEAGLHDGPDYRFGWGLLDVAAASKLLIEQNNKSIHIKELVLSQGETIEISMAPKANTKVTATIVWTDPAATPVAAALDPVKKMLINDLDMRIIGTGTEYRPWILNPLDGFAAATTGDNISDNVEKIEFNTTQEDPLKIRITHKNNLQNGKQAFSLVLSYQPIEAGKTFYWRGNSGNWNDPIHWSLTSGGITANEIPGANDMVFFDENSFSSANQVVNISQNAICSSLVWLSSQESAITFNNHSIEIKNNLIVASAGLKSSDSGVFIFTGDQTDDKTVSLSANDFSKIEMQFSGSSTWKLSGELYLGGIILNQGQLIAEQLNIITKKLTASSAQSKVLNLSKSTLSGVEYSLINSDNLTLNTNELIFKSSPLVQSQIEWNGIDFKGNLVITDALTDLNGNSTYQKITVEGDLKVHGNNIIKNLQLNEGSSLILEAATKQKLSENTSILSTLQKKVNIKSVNGQSASLDFDGHYKLCFDHLIVEGIAIQGQAVINAGLNSTINNSTHWVQEECDNVLFPDFAVQYNCQESIVEFTDLSKGLITGWSWDFGDANSIFSKPDIANGKHVFRETGTYIVSLAISNTKSTSVYTKQIEIVANSLPDNEVILSNNRLFSLKASDGYQWYRDNEIIDAATARGLDYTGNPGLYFVVIKATDCNRISAPYLISSVDEKSDRSLANQIHVFPNPIDDKFNLQVPTNSIPATIDIYDNVGRLIYTHQLNNQKTTIQTDDFSPGLYQVVITTPKAAVCKTIVIR